MSFQFARKCIARNWTSQEKYNKKYIVQNKKNQRLTSQFDPKETLAVYQVPFSFSHPPPSDACKAPGSEQWNSELRILKH